MKIKFNILLLVCLGMMTVSAQTTKKPAAKSTTKPAVKSTAKPAVKPAATVDQGIFAEMETSKGKIIIQLDYKKAPVTVANFISLAEGTNTYVTDPKLKGKPYYDGLKFHRVISITNGDKQDFMVQGGDPLGNGSGGPGYAFKDEFTDATFDKPGVLAMANSGPKTNGSQFFITVAPTTWLTGKHTIFGFVTKGYDIVYATKQNDLINKVTIVRKGADAKKFDAVKVFGDYMSNIAGEEAKEALERAKINEAALKQFEGGQTTPSGLKYIVLKEGTGNSPTANSNIKIHYKGTFTNGKEFDSTKGEPVDYPLNRMIPGWVEGLQLMKEGAKYKFYIPYTLGYGPQAYGPIPAKSDLIFEVELVKINP
jgi:peptidyl-prolyl cis-trans isomerase A (cyclophilin A)